MQEKTVRKNSRPDENSQFMDGHYIASGAGKPVIMEVIIENKQIFFERSLSLASAYAIKNGIDIVLYHKNTKYAWS